MFDSTSETPTSYYSKNAGKINTTVGVQLLKHGASLPAFPVIFISPLSLVKREMYNNMIVVWKYLQCYKMVLKWMHVPMNTLIVCPMANNVKRRPLKRKWGSEWDVLSVWSCWSLYDYVQNAGKEPAANDTVCNANGGMSTRVYVVNAYGYYATGYFYWNMQPFCQSFIVGQQRLRCLSLNPFTAKNAIWRPGVITYPKLNWSVCYKFYYAFCHPVHL